ncbi:MAG: hypothetical protein PHP08_00490 [Candidatus Dojkabacteria bacterium]|nr:hypothetical protein [Candidatus Dojkabacteria bacterium]
MVRNLSLKTDDNFDDKLYSVSKKKGMSKSAFIRLELEKAIEREIPENSSSELRDLSIKQLEDKVGGANILNELVGDQIVNLDKEINEKKSKKIERPKTLSGSNSSIVNKELSEIDIKKDNSTLTSEKNQSEDMNRLDNLLLNRVEKTINSKVSEQNKDENKEQKAVVSRIKPKFKIQKVKRVSDEEQYVTNPVNIEEKVERISRKLREQEEFNKTFREMNGKVNQFCEDGKCLKTEVDTIKGKLEKIDTICEDGKCLRNEVGELKKYFEDMKGSIGNIDKKIPKKENCPICNQGIEESSSYCPNCGLEIKEWTDVHGNKLDWKPYKLRNVK